MSAPFLCRKRICVEFGGKKGYNCKVVFKKMTEGKMTKEHFKKKLKVSSELTYLFSIILMAFSVAMITTTDFGVSMIVAPAYILSLKFNALTFGQSEYIVQGILFIILCIALKRIKLIYFCSFATCLVYGAVLDTWRIIIPIFNPAITPVGSLPIVVRLIFFVLGMVLTSLSVALFYKTYLYPQVYDFFVKAITSRYGFNATRFKIGFDFSCLAAACLFTLVFFHRFEGVGIGTVVMTLLNGAIIGMFTKLLDKNVEFVTLFPRLEKVFQI